jgi:hypothetical protein
VNDLNEEAVALPADARADYVREPAPERIVPDPLDTAVAYRVADAGAAVESDVCREPRRAE